MVLKNIRGLSIIKTHQIRHGFNRIVSCAQRVIKKAHQNFMTTSSKNFELGELIEEWTVRAYDCREFFVFI